jgi:bifunctional DNase/RNase
MLEIRNGETMEIEVRIRALMMDPVINTPVVILREESGTRMLTIWVGMPEASVIALEIEKVHIPRPMTHDLLRNVFLALNVQVKRVVINALKENTFYAQIWVEDKGKEMFIDSRPSDAIALALRADCPIFVDDEVLKTAGMGQTQSASSGDEKTKKWLEGLDPDEMDHA